MSRKPLKKSYLKPFLIWASIQLIILLVLFNFSLFWGYRQLKIFLDNELGENLNLISALIAENIDPEWINELRIEPEFYTRTSSERFLVRISEQQELGNIFILDTTGATLYSNDWSLTPGEPNPYLALDYSAFAIALSGISTTTKIYEFKNRFTKTAYAPILDEWQNVNGILGIEAGDEYFNILRAARKGMVAFLVVSLASVVLLLILMIITFAVLRRTERALLQTATLSTMGEMASMMAHEIRNPLAIMKLSAEELEENLDSGGRELTGFILEEIQRLDGIIKGYMSFSSPQSEPRELMNLNKILEDAVSRIEPEFKNQNIAINLELGELQPVHVDTNSFKQAILNILLNARDAISGGGIININTSREKHNSVQYAVLRISDNGTGISKKDVKRIFEISYTSKPGGSGLGLYITKKIVDNHSGFIKIESRKGKGTDVILGFPEGDVG
ncbi:HAMP domain-containing histidine kinase [bacterium]|nr:HAMP domain-containing histidine kinase [bacterium]